MIKTNESINGNNKYSKKSNLRSYLKKKEIKVAKKAQKISINKTRRIFFLREKFKKLKIN